MKVRSGEVHLTLLERACSWARTCHQEGDILEGIQDLFILHHLMPKLVAWKPAEQGQAPGPTALLQLIHLAVVPDLTASKCGHIHNKQLRAQHRAEQGPTTAS